MTSTASPLPLATPQSLVTADGERLHALHVPHEGGSKAIGVVVAHGFTGSLRKPAVRSVAAALAGHAGVLAFDFRGHGRSSGVSTVGDREVLDVDAAVMRARELGYASVVTCGWSMGGSVVLRHAALHRGVDAVISVSAVSRWFYRDTVPMRRLHWVVERRLGRLVARSALRTRVTGRMWDPLPEPPVELVGRIAPIPLLLVHGTDDAFFPPDQAYLLAAAAGEPCELWVIDGFGHAEAAATPELLERIGAHLPVLLSRGAPG